MIKHISITCFFLSLFTFTIKAQLFTVGGGATYAINQELSGVNLRMYANSGHAFSYGPEVSFYPKQTVTRDTFNISAQLMDFNFMTHFNFYPFKDLGFYASGGLNFSVQKEELDALTFNNTSFGPRIGLGLQYVRNNLMPYFEYSHIFGPINENTINLGVVYTFKKVAKEHDIEVE